MVDCSHIYMTAHGEYFSGSPWTGEVGQIGLRIGFHPIGSEPAKGTVFDIMTNGTAVVDTGSQAGTNGTLTKAWTCRIGPLGSTENMDADLQIDMAEDFRTIGRAHV